MRRFWRILSVLVLPPVLAGGAAAEPPALHASPAAELRLGLYAHDPGGREKGSADLKLALILPLPVAEPLRAATGIALRAELGASVNPSGRTSHVHAGLNLGYDLTARIFVEFGLGIAVHDGPTRAPVPVNRSALGCAAQFRESAAIGYRFDRHWSLLAGVEHLSNGGLCRRNRGLTSAGLSLGYRF